MDGHPADIAVEDFLLVVVHGLQHLVADAKGLAEAFDGSRANRIPGARRVEHGLQPLIQVAGAELGAVHRRQHLHVAERIEPEADGMRSRTIVMMRSMMAGARRPR